MKALIHSIQSFFCPFINPLARVALPFFFMLAFMPSILRLVLHDSPMTNPLATASPVAAGFWLAAGFREIRVNFALLGTLISALLWLANWLMTADGGCCAAGH